MRRLLTIAFRNVLRNKRRSALSALAIVVGVGAIIFLQGFANSFVKNMLEDAVLAKIGAVQVHRKGFLDAEQSPLERDLPDDPAFAAKLRAMPGVTAVTRRISFDGMLNNGVVSSMVVATAIDPATEYDVCPRRRVTVAAGSKPLEAGDGAGGGSGALVGVQLAASLDAKEGASLTLLSATKGGASNALDLTVQGFLPSRFIAESKRMATVPLAYAQDLLKMRGRVTEYVIAVSPLERADEVAARLRAELGGDYQVDTWRELAPMARDAAARMKWVLGIITAILFLLVATAIVNTMMMSVYERVREIGTMVAVGVRRRQVLLLFLAEAAALGLGGAAAGAALGATVVALLGRTGVLIRPPGGDPAVFYPFIEGKFVGGAVVFAVIGTVIAAMLPAWRASRLRPADALRAL